MWVHDPKRTKVESKPMAVETELNAYRSQGREGSKQDMHTVLGCVTARECITLVRSQGLGSGTQAYTAIREIRGNPSSHLIRKKK